MSEVSQFNDNCYICLHFKDNLLVNRCQIHNNEVTQFYQNVDYQDEADENTEETKANDNIKPIVNKKKKKGNRRFVPECKCKSIKNCRNSYCKRKICGNCNLNCEICNISYCKNQNKVKCQEAFIKHMNKHKTNK